MKQFIFFALALYTICLSHAQQIMNTIEDDSNCDKICEMDYQPICATNKNGEKKTFGNKCALESVICQEKAAYTIVNDGHCIPESDEPPIADNGNCDKICEMSYEPICAVNEIGDKKTFGNKCALESVICQERAAYTIVNVGQCVPESDASALCTMSYKPICATNPLTAVRENFANGCELGVTSCLGNLTYTDVTDGECQTLEPNCPSSCIMSFDPVCGTHPATGERKTFANACALGVESCLASFEYLDVSKGECKIVENKCPTVCAMQFDPVCATNPITGERRTHANSCALGVESCEANIVYTDVTKGDCNNNEIKINTI